MICLLENARMGLEGGERGSGSSVSHPVELPQLVVVTNNFTSSI